MSDIVEFGITPLETQNLLLRKLKMSDVQDVFEYASDPEVTKYTFWHTHTSIEDSKKFISWLTGDHVACWAIVLKENMKVIGTCFFHSFDLAQKKAEVAFNLSRKYWNQGFATEAAKKVVLHGFKTWKLNKIEGTCMIDNIASVRVLEKIGMTYQRTLRKSRQKNGIFYSLKLYSILASDVKSLVQSPEY